MKQILLILSMVIVKMSIAQTAAEYYKEAGASIQNKDYKSALKAIEKAIEIDSLTAEFQIIKARLLSNLELYQESYDTYNAAISLFPDESWLYNDMGDFLCKFREFDLAIQYYTKSMELADGDTSKYSHLANRGMTKYDKRDFEGAYADLVIAYNFNPNNLATLVNFASVCDQVGREDEALIYLLKAIEIDSTYYFAYANIGFKYQELGQHERAIEYYNKVLAFDPDEPLGYSNRSFSKLKLGDTTGAMHDIEKSIKLYPANAYAYKIRALIYIELEKIDKACMDLQEALDRRYTLTYGDEVINLQIQYCKN